MTNKTEILEKLSEGIIDMNDKIVVTLCKKVIKKNMNVQEAIVDGLARGMRKVGELFEDETYSIPEVLLCADALDKGLNILKPHLNVDEKSKDKHRAIICTVEGDIHCIGKNMVKLMLEVGGFEVLDLGEDVSSKKILKGIKESDAKIVGLSTMMTPTLVVMKETIDEIRKKYDKGIKIIIGGASVSKKTAEEFKADGYGKNAPEAVNEAIRLSRLIIKNNSIE